MISEIIGLDAFKKSNAKSICLGTFDGFHKGHQKLAENADFMLTFDPHPKNILQPDNPIERLTLPNEQALFVPNLLIIPFNENISKLSAPEFLEQYITPLQPKQLIVGYDFKFGNKGMGNIDLLMAWGKNNACQIIEIPIQKHLDNTPFKSSIIRKKLKEDPNYAFELLGHPYILSGTVIPGEKRGRTIGFPTANLSVKKNKCIPKLGVYGSTTRIGNSEYTSITYIGKKPTFNQQNVQIETHILDGFSKDIYGQDIIISINQFIREDQPFPDKNKLIEQINKDIALINH
tara:strand:+ start:13855 stop:14724 length:870 start_codon:yes stop_codon:yes gene_type:complete